MIFDPENGTKTRRKERKLWVTFPVWLQRVALHLAKGEHYCLSVSNFRCLFWIKSGAKRRPHWARPKTPQKTQIREEPKVYAILMKTPRKVPKMGQALFSESGRDTA